MALFEFADMGVRINTIVEYQRRVESVTTSAMNNERKWDGKSCAVSSNTVEFGNVEILRSSKTTKRRTNY